MDTSEYDCMNCGACCRCFPIFASQADAKLEPRIRRETRKLAEHLQTQDKAFQMFPLPFHSSCVFLKKDQLCQIYQSRPQICRSFEAGSPQCLEARRRVEIGKNREG